MEAGNLVGDDVMIGIVRDRLRPGRRATADSCSTAFRGRWSQAISARPDGGRARAAGRARHRRPGRRAGAPARDAADLQQLRYRTRRPNGRRACGECGGQLVTRADDGDRDRAGAVEGVSAADQAARRLLLGARPTFRAIDGNQPPDVVTATVDEAVDEAAAVGGGRRVIVCKSPAEIERMRAANVLVADVLAELAAMVAPGVTTADLDAAAEMLVRAGGAEPAFKGYRGYPATLCASVNEQVVHGIPSERTLIDGDIISLDMGVKLNGFYGDSAVTVPVGRVSDEVAEAAAGDAGGAARRGSSRCGSAGASRISATPSSSTSRRNGFSVVREFVGHGIGVGAARGAADRQLRRAGARPAAGRGHGAGDRADGEHGPAGGEGARRRLDRGDERRQPVGALRAHRGGDEGRAAGADAAYAGADAGD